MPLQPCPEVTWRGSPTTPECRGYLRRFEKPFIEIQGGMGLAYSARPAKARGLCEEIIEGGPGKKNEKEEERSTARGGSREKLSALAYSEHN